MANELEKKVPPQSIEAEMALIGAMLIEKDAIIKALEIVREEDFYKEVHKHIFGAIRPVRIAPSGTLSHPFACFPIALKCIYSHDILTPCVGLCQCLQPS